MKNAFLMIAALALLALGGVALALQVKIRSLEAADVAAERRARQHADSLAQRVRADSTAALQRDSIGRTKLADRIHFGFDRYKIQPTDAEILDQKLAILDANPRARIRIIGHCDEWGGEVYNMALGRRRAVAARDYLIEHGIAAGRIETMSAGKGAPLDSAHDIRAWARNRRDEFQMIGG
ncbi:MAG TPA: OmpA family protein [Gemmatimonadales bacterium]|nr:OmpA family protein [Gemmatimonadales bacterium]